MNINEYISSGVLEAYVLGELSWSEKEKVEKYANEYPQINREIQQIQSAFRNITVQSQKHTELKEYSLQKTQFQFINKKSSQYSEHRIKVKYSKHLAAIAICFALLASFIAADLYLKLRRIQTQLNELQSGAVNSDFTHEIVGISSELQHDEYSYLFSNYFRKIDLLESSATKSSHVILFWNDKSHELFSFIDYLPTPASGFQYQLWAIHNDVAIDAGTIPLDFGNSFIRMKRIKNAETFMITLEPEGGSEQPTSDKNQPILKSH